MLCRSKTKSHLFLPQDAVPETSSAWVHSTVCSPAGKTHAAVFYCGSPVGHRSLQKTCGVGFSPWFTTLIRRAPAWNFHRLHLLSGHMNLLCILCRIRHGYLPQWSYMGCFNWLHRDLLQNLQWHPDSPPPLPSSLILVSHE